MKGKGKILRVICPYCGREMFKHRTELSMTRSSKNIWASSVWMKDKVRYDYRCHDCVYMFPVDWFDKFNTFEHLVLREGEDIVEWKKNIKIPEKEEVKLKW